MTWRSIPGARALASYRVGWLRHDAVAGLVLTTLLVPQGMAYAQLAGLPPITGLYTTILCLIGYAAFGPSRILVLGPDSSLGPMIAATILPILGANGNPEHAIALASMLALIVGAIMIVAGLAKLGFIADLLSKPTQIGYMNGLALTILVGQLPKLFGFSRERQRPDRRDARVRARAHHGQDGRRRARRRALEPRADPCARPLAAANPGRARRRRRGHRAAAVLDLASHGVSLVGTLPKGFPPLTVPSPISDLPLLVAGAIGIAIVALADTISTASAFAARTGQEVDGNGEMIGIGVANVAAGFFQGFPVSTSGSRTAVAEQAGAKTQVTGLVGAALIILMLVLVPGLLSNLPKPTLAAVVIAASLSLADIAGTVRLWHAAPRRVPAVDHRVPRRRAPRRARRHRRRRRPVDPERLPPRLVALPDDARTRPRPRGHHDRDLHPEAEELPGLVIFRFDAPLFFANARAFRDQIRAPRRRASRDRCGSSSPPSRSPTSTRPPPTCSPISTRSSTRPALRSCSPS